MRKKILSMVLAVTLLMSCITPIAHAASGDVEKLENAIKVVTDSVSEIGEVIPDQKTADTISLIFEDFISVARTSGTILGAINGSVTFLKLIGLVKDSNAEALANIRTQLQTISEQMEATQTQLNRITTQMSQIQASAEFNTRTEKAIMLQNSWKDFEYRYMEKGMDALMTDYDIMLRDGMRDWCLNKADARTKDGADHSRIVLHYAPADGEYALVYTPENGDPAAFDPADRYLVLSPDFLPESLSWNVDTYRTDIADGIASRLSEYSADDDAPALEFGNFPAFTEEGSEELTDALIRQIAEDAVNVLVYQVAADEVNQSSAFALQVEQEFSNYCTHLLAPEDGMDAIFNVFFLTHAFEYQIADALKLFCNEMAMKTGVYGSFAANILGMSSFVTGTEKTAMLDAYCDALVAIGQAKDNCLTGSDRYCYLTNRELYLGEVHFTDQFTVNTSERSQNIAYESFSSTPTRIDFWGDWKSNASPTLIGDSNALLLMYMLQSNGEATDLAHLKRVLGSSATDYGTIVTDINSEQPLPLNSTLSMKVTNVIGSYFKNISTASLNNLPSSADSDYIAYRRMTTGSVLDDAGGLEVNRVLDAAAVYIEEHWYWEKDEAAVLGGAADMSSFLKSTGKTETDVTFPGTHYYRNDYTQYLTYNCLVTVPSQKYLSHTQYSPLASYKQLCKEFSKPDITPVTPFQPSEKPESGFVDVPAEAYYHDAVQWAKEAGITNGTDATHFSPDAICTRAQMVTFLWRAAGSPVVNYAIPFTDLEEDAYYTEAVRWAAALGITGGVDGTHFNPYGRVTREQTAAMIYRYAKTQGQGFVGSWAFLLNYADANTISEWADETMHWCVMHGILQGSEDGRLDPQGISTRAQITAMLFRYRTLQESR